MGDLEHNHANHIRWERQLPEVREKMIEDGEIEAPIPCKYIKVNTDVFNKLRGYQYRNGKLVPVKRDKRFETVDYYDRPANPDHQPKPMEMTGGKMGHEKAFYDAIGLSEEQHRFPVVDEHRHDDSVATMVYDHKTGGEVAMVNRDVLKRTRRKNYGTCLSTISPYRS
tara:strand:+ start:862 stop:1365 length:504 start_codon:yes stop_codon:yes gene_type:complete